MDRRKLLMALDKAVDSAQLNADLTAVADAIRTKGGTSAQLAFPDGFVSVVQAIQTGPELQIIVTVTSGATVTATKGSLSVSGTSVNGTCTLIVPEAGTWSVKATLSGQTSNTKNITFTDSYTTSLTFFNATITVTVESGATVTLKKGGRQSPQRRATERRFSPSRRRVHIPSRPQRAGRRRADPSMSCPPRPPTR